jgi:hypothetical protein
MMEPKDAARFFMELIDYHDYQESCAEAIGDYPDCEKYHRYHREELRVRLNQLTKDFPTEVAAAEEDYENFLIEESEKA